MQQSTQLRKRPVYAATTTSTVPRNGVASAFDDGMLFGNDAVAVARAALVVIAAYTAAVFAATRAIDALDALDALDAAAVVGAANTANNAKFATAADAPARADAFTVVCIFVNKSEHIRL